MSHSNETHVLVKTASSEKDAPILKVVRTYLSANRAAEDRDLLREADPMSFYAVLPIEHIDN